MQSIYTRPVAILLLIALATIVIMRGLVPALSKVDTDFPNYFTAAKIVADGGDVRRLYDDEWFQEQMRRYRIGVASAGKFSPFPPPTALLLVPLTRFEALTALRVITVLNMLCLAGAIVLLARILSWSIVNASVFVLLSGYAILNGLRFGQVYILMSFLCILGYYAYLKKRPILAGICFGIFLPIKYYPIIILVHFALAKQWKVLYAGATMSLAIVLASIALLGWKIHEEFLYSVIGNHLVANLSLQDPFTAVFQSFDTLFRRLFVFDAVRNPHPFAAVPALHIIGLLVTKIAILLVAVATLIKLARDSVELPAALSIGLLGILLLLLAPATGTYYFVLLWLPVGLLGHYFLCNRGEIHGYIVLCGYALIGFFPYRFTYPFEGQGGLTVLAYPRLFLLLAMFIVCVHFIWRRTDRSRASGTKNSPVPSLS